MYAILECCLLDERTVKGEKQEERVRKGLE